MRSMVPEGINKEKEGHGFVFGFLIVIWETDKILQGVDSTQMQTEQLSGYTIIVWMGLTHEQINFVLQIIIIT